MPTLASLNPQFRPHAERFFAWAQKRNPGLVVTSAKRTFAEQQALFLKAQRGQNDGLPASPPGQSDHEFGLAFDMVRLQTDPRSDPILADLGEAWQLAGGRWWSGDPVHFGAPIAWIKAARQAPSSWSPPAWVP